MPATTYAPTQCGAGALARVLPAAAELPSRGNAPNQPVHTSQTTIA